MEENRNYIRLLIIESRQRTLDIYDDIIKEFDRLYGPTVSNKKYRSRQRIKEYRHNVGVLLCKYRALSKFIDKSLMAFKFYVTLQGDRADRALNRLKAAQKELNVDCHKGREKRWK